MADVITRFKLETTQYDSALRNATKALKDIVHQTELAGKDFKEFSDKSIQAARALGQQATGASNAKDKVKELVSSYNEMAKTYNLMSEAMKKSEGGKALSASLQQLQQRIKDRADVILETAKNNGGVYVYRNQCDKYNNTDDVINNEMFILSTSIEPGMGAGKMVQELYIYRKGGMSSALISDTGA